MSKYFSLLLLTSFFARDGICSSEGLFNNDLGVAAPSSVRVAPSFKKEATLFQ